MPDPRGYAARTAVIAVACLAVGFGLGLSVKPPARQAPAAAIPPPVAPPPRVSLPTPPPPLGRAALIAAAAAAASAYAAGEEATAHTSDIVDRRFRVAIPFGCRSAAPSVEPAGAARPSRETTQGGGGQTEWSLDRRRHSLTLTATPVRFTDTALVQTMPRAAEVETVEGFWLPRPWTVAEGCPDLPESAGAAADPQTLALATFSERGGSRLAERGGRPYRIVRKLNEGEAADPATDRLVLEGRIGGAPDGGAVHCHADSPRQRPVCLIAVRLDRVAFEEPGSGEVLAEWRPDSSSSPP